MSTTSTQAITFYLPDSAATEALGALLAQQFMAPSLIFLHGELGAGKTTLVRGWLRQLGYTGPVNSPTYTLIEPYTLNSLESTSEFIHCDLYRLSAAAELEFLGLDELFHDHSIVVIEWAQRAAEQLPPPQLEIMLSYSDTGRTACLTLNKTLSAATATEQENILRQFEVRRDKNSTSKLKHGQVVQRK